MQDFEKLGVFYLGKAYDPVKKTTGDLILYDSRDLVTHAVCVGMTGSGKTGLCIGLVEEAAIDNVPVIIIDPKGDLSNLLLTFPDLRPEDFRPWINPDEARTQGMSEDQFAAAQAALWTKGLAEWGEDGARIARLKAAAGFSIYTPRSTAGLQVSIMQSLAAPPAEIVEDAELLRERVNAAAASLLALAGIQADPSGSREYTLLASLFDAAWRQGTTLDLAALIGQIQKPPFSRLGALDLNSFYPEKERFELAMSLNNILASPGFNAWLEGDPLDVSSLLHTAEGKPRVSIFSISHLNDNERMFFVTLLLNQVLAWMRSQQGTTSLRAILYMDEIFGFFPPVKNPPAKQPLLTLLKQARAFGLGVVLATQNPVDLDYKGLANAGTWFIGRLQTDRDKARVLDGLEGAAAESGAGFSRQRMDALLSGLGKRVFLMNNVHEDAPVLFQTRWTLSYLRGPLSRDQIRKITGNVKPAAAPVAAAPAAAAPAPVPAGDATPPILQPSIPQYYLPPDPGAQEPIQYTPVLVGAVQNRFVDAKLGVDVPLEEVYVTPISDGPVAVNWGDSEELDTPVTALEKQPQPGGTFTPLPAAASDPKSYARWTREFTAWLTNNSQIALYRSPSSGLVANYGESERDFRVRNSQAAREARDSAVQALRDKYASQMATLQERLRRAQMDLEKQSQESGVQKVQAAISVGATVLGALFGRKVLTATNIGRAATAARAATRVQKESQDVARSNESVAAVQAMLDALQSQMQTEVAGLQTAMDASGETLESVTIPAKKTAIAVRLVSLAWRPS